MKEVKNEQWSVKSLAHKVESKEIYKPKYQRKRKWDILPKKENVPNVREVCVKVERDIALRFPKSPFKDLIKKHLSAMV